MADEIINLNKARKERAKAVSSATATQNRVVYGQTKSQKAEVRSLSDKLKRALDAARRDRKD